MGESGFFCFLSFSLSCLYPVTSLSLHRTPEIFQRLQKSADDLGFIEQLPEMMLLQPRPRSVSQDARAHKKARAPCSNTLHKGLL